MAFTNSLCSVNAIEAQGIGLWLELYDSI